MKGAAGQAIQNFNVAFGFDERLGLNVTTTLLKLGGELLEDAAAMRAAAAGDRRRCAATGPVVVVHGGGRAIDAELRARGKAPRVRRRPARHRRRTLDAVVAVLAGRINTRFVAALGAAGGSAVGLTGADAPLGLATLAPALQTTTGDDGRISGWSA